MGILDKIKSKFFGETHKDDATVYKVLHGKTFKTKEDFDKYSKKIQGKPLPLPSKSSLPSPSIIVIPQCFGVMIEVTEKCRKCSDYKQCLLETKHNSVR